MPRPIRTLLLSAAALGALATAAIAAPTPPMNHDAAGGMPGTHAAGTAQMHAATGDMAQMHAAMMADPGVHDSMLDDPTMQAHRTEYGVDVAQMRRWYDDGRSIGEMHTALAEQGIDVDAMQSDCPMLSDDSMAAMHGEGGLHAGGHHSTSTR